MTRSRCALPGSLRHSGLPDALLPRGEAGGVRGLSLPLGRCPRRPVPDSGARWVSHNRGEADPLTSLTQVTAVWWGSIAPPELQRLSPAPLARPRPRFAQRCRLHIQAGCERELRADVRSTHLPALLAPGTHYSCCMRRLKEEGGEKKVCQAACSQWACMDALVQTRSYRSATPLPVSGLNEILSRRKCHDLERLLQSHSTSRTTAVRQRLTSSGALAITTHLTGCESTVSAKQRGMKQPRSHVKGANRTKLYFPSSATGESLLWVWVQNYKHQSLWSGK